MLARTKRRAVIAASLAAASIGTVGVAQATSYVYWDNWTTSELGPRHSLYETSVRLKAGPIACTSAKNMDLSQAGTAYCVDVVGAATAHPYDQTLRYPWCGTPQGYGSADMRCRGEY